MRFKIDWASPIVGTKFTVFALFYFVLAGNFQVQGAYIWRGDLKEVFFCVKSLGALYLEGLVSGGAYFRNITVVSVIKGFSADEGNYK